MEINDLKILVGYKQVMENPTAVEPLAAATEQPPCATDISPNPFGKKVQSPATTATAVSSVIPVTTVQSPATNVVSTVIPVTTVQSSFSSVTASTSKRGNTMWLNPPPKVAKIFSTNAPYTAKEDRLILEFASKNVAEVGGKRVWKVLQESGVIPNRTFESLRTRYHRYLKKDI